MDVFRDIIDFKTHIFDKYENIENDQRCNSVGENE